MKKMIKSTILVMCLVFSSASFGGICDEQCSFCRINDDGSFWIGVMATHAPNGGCLDICGSCAVGISWGDLSDGMGGN